MPAWPHVPLWCKSHFSFLEGASSPDELVAQAGYLGLPALALTDRDGVYGLVRAFRESRSSGVRLLAGAQVTLDDGSLLPLIAQDRAGYGRLCRLLTRGRLRCAKGESRVSREEVLEHAEGLLALWPGPAGAPAASSGGARLKEAFGDRLYALVVRHREAEEAAREAALRAEARRCGIPVVAGVEVLYHTRARRPLQDVLTSIRCGVPLAAAGRRLRANAEHALLAPEEMAERFTDDPSAVARTGEVAERCTFSLSQLRYRYPLERLPDGTSESAWLRQLTLQGAAARYPGGVPPEVRKQVERELALIEELEYGGYFLTMREIVEFCREQGILCQGRGSAANSAVCYCLGITAIDPVRMGLLFERFLSRERAEPPDIDLDIAHERREEVIQHLYQRHGRSHAAMVANVIRYRARSAVREVGKALGIPATTLDRLARLVSPYGDVTPDLLEQVGLEPRSPAHQHLVRLVGEIQDCPRHLSIHPGGFLLGHDPVSELVPIENGSMKDRTVIQWDKDDLEVLGLFKVDLLGLGALTMLDLCFQLLERHHGVKLDLATIPAEDPATYDMLCRADTVGVFQVESRAQMSMLPRLRPRSFHDIVIEVSLVRPGPITGGMVHPYLRRRRGEEAVEYPHPSLVPVLSKTLGVPIFQEQVMRLAMVAADYSPGEADQLRRDMAAWRKAGRMETHRERLISRMIAKGIPEEFAERVFQQIRGFGEYGFPESHAASFSLIAYATAWLKCHHPAVFTCALLNAQPMGFYAPSTIVNDARRGGVKIRPVQIQASDWDCTLEADDAVRMGLRYVKGLGEAHWLRIQRARKEGALRSVADVVRRTGLDEGALQVLAEAGAFEGLSPDRRSALWQARGQARSPAGPLALEAPEPEVAFAPLGRFETVAWDHRATHHSPREHPLAPLRAQLARLGLRQAQEINSLPDGRAVRYAGLVLCRQQPRTANGVTFITLEDETGMVNLILWRPVFQRHSLLARTVSFLGVTGKIQAREGVTYVIASALWEPALDLTPRVPSRDFR